MIDAKKEIADYIKDKKSVTTGFWIFAALATTFVIVVSAYVNWSAGFARGELLGGLIAVALDVALVTMGLRSWRGHNWFQTLVDWLCIITLMIVGITCVALYFGIENNRAQYDMNLNLNNALLSTVSGNSATATRASILENNAQVRSIAKLVKAPPPKETKTFESLARFVGIDNPDDMTFLFNMFMGVALVISSVLMSTRVNSYYSSIQLNQLAKSIRENNAAITRALSAPIEKPKPQPKQKTEKPQSKQTSGTGAQRKKDDITIEESVNAAKEWLKTLTAGEKISAKQLRKETKQTTRAAANEVMSILKDRDVIETHGNGNAPNYYHYGHAPKAKKETKNANIFAMKN